jgi:hypothetical protein
LNSSKAWIRETEASAMRLAWGIISGVEDEEDDIEDDNPCSLKLSDPSSAGGTRAGLGKSGFKPKPTIVKESCLNFRFFLKIIIYMQI